ncbi:POC1 TETTS ame: Full=POC1 centriolar homolog, putative [Babesia ovata]|uniref:POC1 centriolar homolog, putative n=1 Tax=Babesia ovata TaxID=189622 RepID=A0A2H6K9T3_9APIC|nr:POC1 TETTS ame: Full=POC1 centriolar homolog, putative [Babesia ovata]GBE59764.1 POC1 TETTS ame: Full=POC1 centriolar homolog, putative [Babesia ovata]
MSNGDASAPSEEAPSDQTVVSPASLPKRAIRLHLNKTLKKNQTLCDSWDLLAYESCLSCVEGGQVEKDARKVRVRVPVNVPSGLDVLTHVRYLNKRKLESALSDVEVNSFINCGGIVASVEVVGPFTFDEREEYSVFTVASCSCAVQPDEGPSNYLVLHEIVVKPHSAEKSATSANCVVDIHKPRLTTVSPLTGRSCVGVEWINGENFTATNEDTADDQLFLALLMKDGSIELCKIDLGCALTYNEVVSDEKEIPYDPPILLWSYDTRLDIPNQRINALAVSYETAPRYPYSHQSSVIYTTHTVATDAAPSSVPQRNTVIVAGGTNDGYVYIWKFDWDEMRRTSGEKDGFSPFFSQMMPIFVDPQDAEPSHRVVSLHFLPSPQSYVLAIATYMGNVITWDIRNGTLEGEMCAYYTINRPVTTARWTENRQFLLLGGTSVMCIEWHSKWGMTTLAYDRVPRVAYYGTCDNICWSMDSTANMAYFVYDDGLFVQTPIITLTRKPLQDVMTTYLWEPFNRDDEEVASLGLDDTQDPMTQAQELAELQFRMDLRSIRSHGICITRNGNRYRGPRKSKGGVERVIRNKVYSHHCVKARTMRFGECELSFVAYGGNTGLLHVIVKLD